MWNAANLTAMVSETSETVIESDISVTTMVSKSNEAVVGSDTTASDGE